MTHIDPSRLVFVGGLHRSGTTPFARTLAEHPDVSGISDSPAREDEGQHLQSVYPKAKVYGGSGRFAHHAAAHLTDTSPLVGPDQAEAMLASWEPYWDTGARLLVEKSPPNIIMSRFLQACFPGSAYIAVVRHPVAVALSNKKWRRVTSANPRKFESLGGLVQHWLVAHDILAGDLPHVERALVVYYENLVANPEAELQRVGRFLGLSRPFPASSLTAAHGSGYAAWWDELRHPWRPGAWQRRRIERRDGARIAAFGYDIDDLANHRTRDTDPLGPWSS
jgi:hypothetical protein